MKATRRGERGDVCLLRGTTALFVQYDPLLGLKIDELGVPESENCSSTSSLLSDTTDGTVVVVVVVEVDSCGRRQ